MARPSLAGRSVPAAFEPAAFEPAAFEPAAFEPAAPAVPAATNARASSASARHRAGSTPRRVTHSRITRPPEVNSSPSPDARIAATVSAGTFTTNRSTTNIA